MGVAVNPCCCHLGCRRAASQATLCTYLRTACRSQELMTIVEDLIFVTIVAVPIAVATLDVFLLVPSFTLNTTIAFATLDVSCSCHCCPHLVTLAAISWMFLATRVIIDSHCHPCCCHLGCFLFVPPLSSYCRHCCCHLGCFFAARGLAPLAQHAPLAPLAPPCPTRPTRASGANGTSGAEGTASSPDWPGPRPTINQRYAVDPAIKKGGRGE